MKKLVLAASAIVILGMSSCKKDYTCDCKETTGSGTTFESTNYPNTRLVDARENCKDRQSFWQNGPRPNTECTIL
jgi:hypothetical protein